MTLTDAKATNASGNPLPLLPPPLPVVVAGAPPLKRVSPPRSPAVPVLFPRTPFATRLWRAFASLASAAAAGG